MPRHFTWLLAIAACDGTPAATDAPQLDAAPDGAPDAFVDPRVPCLGTPAPMTAPDPLVLTGTAALLVITLIGATMAPTRQAARTDPLTILRSE